MPKRFFACVGFTGLFYSFLITLLYLTFSPTAAVFFVSFAALIFIITLTVFRLKKNQKIKTLIILLISFLLFSSFAFAKLHIFSKISDNLCSQAKQEYEFVFLNKKENADGKKTYTVKLLNSRNEKYSLLPMKHLKASLMTLFRVSLNFHPYTTRRYFRVFLKTYTHWPPFPKSKERAVQVFLSKKASTV